MSTSTSASTRTTAQACAKRGFGRDRRSPTPLAASRHVSDATSNAQTSSNRVSPSSPPHPPKTHTVPRLAEAVGGWNAADAPSRARARAASGVGSRSFTPRSFRFAADGRHAHDVEATPRLSSAPPPVFELCFFPLWDDTFFDEEGILNVRKCTSSNTRPPAPRPPNTTASPSPTATRQCPARGAGGDPVAATERHWNAASMTCRSFRNASSPPRPPKMTCATPTGGSAKLSRARRSSPSASRMGAQACASLHVGHAPVVSRRSLRCEPPRPIASTSRGSPRGDPPHKHAPPSEAHPQWPQRAREDAVSSLPPRLLAPSGSGSSGRRTPALASAGASETAPIARLPTPVTRG